MNISIIRGQNQIGGNIIEICSKNTKIILDTESELQEKIPKVPDIKGLFQDKPNYNAVLISHYHSDHIGLINNILPNIPIFMGEKCYHIYKTANEYLGNKTVKISNFLQSEKEFDIRDIKVKPILCDHSAFDSYMILLYLENKKVLYTGDFRANGRKSFYSLLNKLEKVDILITEGTTVTRENSKSYSEKSLEKQAIDIIKNNDAPIFALMSSTNIDRIVTFYKVAKNTNRLFLEDVYMSSITSALGNNIPNPKDFENVKVFLTIPTEKNYSILKKYKDKKIGRKEISKRKFIMCVLSSMVNYLEKLSKEISFNGGILFYSMWKGYLENEEMKQFINFMKEKEVKIIKLHTSGHADVKTIDALIKKTEPEYIIPIHTKNAKWFERYSGCKIIHDYQYNF